MNGKKGTFLQHAAMKDPDSWEAGGELLNHGKILPRLHSLLEPVNLLYSMLHLKHYEVQLASDCPPVCFSGKKSLFGTSQQVYIFSRSLLIYLFCGWEGSATLIADQHWRRPGKQGCNFASTQQSKYNV